MPRLGESGQQVVGIHSSFLEKQGILSNQQSLTWRGKPKAYVGGQRVADMDGETAGQIARRKVAAKRLAAANKTAGAWTESPRTLGVAASAASVRMVPRA